MSEATEQAPARPATAGDILRQARQAQGVHIAALAAAMKVSQRKLEALEADRLDELPDATFTRALAQAVCRTLKIDPAPVLALLPQHAAHRLEHVAEGLKEPFRERAGRSEPADWVGGLSSPAAWGVLAIFVLTVVVWLLPQRWLPSLQGTPAASAPGATVTTVVPAPLPAEPASAPAAAPQGAPAAAAPAVPESR
jgi:cytoskeleton protein RodZ